MSQDRVLATYLIETPHPLEHAAAVIAGEQSSGTFVSVPGETNELKERYGAQVVRIQPLASVREPSLPGSKGPRAASGSTEYRRGLIEISFPLHNFGPSLPSLLSTVAGNLYELQEVSGLRLVDLELPAAFAQRYPGPGFGIDGTRKLANVHGRPLIGVAFEQPEQARDRRIAGNRVYASARHSCLLRRDRPAGCPPDAGRSL